MRKPGHCRARRTGLCAKVHDRCPIALSRPAIHGPVIDFHVRILKPRARHIRRQRRRARADSRRSPVHHHRRTHHQRRAESLHFRQCEKLRIERLDSHFPTTGIRREQKAKVVRRRRSHCEIHILRPHRPAALIEQRYFRRRRSDSIAAIEEQQRLHEIVRRQRHFPKLPDRRSQAMINRKARRVVVSVDISVVRIRRDRAKSAGRRADARRSQERIRCSRCPPNLKLRKRQKIHSRHRLRHALNSHQIRLQAAQRRSSPCPRSIVVRRVRRQKDLIKNRRPAILCDDPKIAHGALNRVSPIKNADVVEIAHARQLDLPERLNRLIARVENGAVSENTIAVPINCIRHNRAIVRRRSSRRPGSCEIHKLPARHRSEQKKHEERSE